MRFSVLHTDFLEFMQNILEYFDVTKEAHISKKILYILHIYPKDISQS